MAREERGVWPCGAARRKGAERGGERFTRKRAPANGGFTCDDLSAHAVVGKRRYPALGAGLHVLQRGRYRAPDWEFAGGEAVLVRLEGRFKASESELVAPHGAHEGMTLDARQER